MRSLQSFAEPDFREPEGAADWFAVVSLSLALLLLPAGLAVLVGAHGGGWAKSLALVVSMGAVTSAIANLLEGGAGIAEAGDVYFVATMVMVATMLLLGGVLLAHRPRQPGLVVLATLIGMLLLERGGGVLILVAWTLAAVRETRRSTATN